MVWSSHRQTKSVFYTVPKIVLHHQWAKTRWSLDRCGEKKGVENVWRGIERVTVLITWETFLFCLCLIPISPNPVFLGRGWYGFSQLWAWTGFPAWWWKTVRQGKRLLVWWTNSETDLISLRFMLLFSAAAGRVCWDLQISLMLLSKS